jgi:hypothetical protein
MSDASDGIGITFSTRGRQGGWGGSRQTLYTTCQASSTSSGLGLAPRRCRSLAEGLHAPPQLCGSGCWMPCCGSVAAYCNRQAGNGGHDMCSETQVSEKKQGSVAGPCMSWPSGAHHLGRQLSTWCSTLWECTGSKCVASNGLQKGSSNGPDWSSKAQPASGSSGYQGGCLLGHPNGQSAETERSPSPCLPVCVLLLDTSLRCVDNLLVDGGPTVLLGI